MDKQWTSQILYQKNPSKAREIIKTKKVSNIEIRKE